MKLSVIIITKNEKDNIIACLESVKWADEIVVVDTGSSDKTAELCGRYTDKIFFSEWMGFGQLKNFAVQKTTGDWILNIDADERVSGRLRDEIRKVVSCPSHFDGFYIPFLFYFMGHPMRYGGLGSEKHLRLFKKDKGRFKDDAVHEAVAVSGAVGKLGGFMEHRSYRDLKEYFRKFNFYTSITAEEKHRRGVKFCFFNLFRIPFEIFVRFVLKLGFLDGVYGFVYAVLSAFYAWVKYIKLWEIERSVKM
ncbi:MAG: glycosyltransferase family 2 protein [bacterium]